MSRCWSIDPLIISKKIGSSTANIIGRKLACSIGAIYTKFLSGAARCGGAALGKV